MCNGAKMKIQNKPVTKLLSSDILTVRKYKNRLALFYGLATEPERKLNGGWYSLARDIIRKINVQYPQYSPEQIAGAIAVLSPNVSWSKNLYSAQVLINEHSKGIRDWKIARKVNGYGRNRQKALDILSGDLSQISGPKVTAFYENLLGGGVNTSATVDIHMLRAAYANLGIGEGTANAAIIAPLNINKRIQIALIDLAGELEIEVHSLQAIIWQVVRRLRLSANQLRAYGEIDD